MSSKYYTLLGRCDATLWTIEFGDYDREVVEDEKEDRERDEELQETPIRFKIICTDESQDAINAKVAELNAMID